MLQTIQGRTVYVVEFDTMPKLPITGLIEEESKYNRFIQRLCGIFTPDRLLYKTSMYTTALNLAFETKTITEPGKYAIYVDFKTHRWEVARVIE